MRRARVYAVRGLLVSLCCGMALFPQLAFAGNPYSFQGPDSPLAPDTSAFISRMAFGPDGEIYYGFMSNQVGESDVMFTRSTDFGATWSTPVKVDTDPPGTNHSSLTQILGSPQGDVYVFFADDRNGIPTDSLRLNASHDRGQTWLSDDILVFDGATCEGLNSEASLGASGTLYVICSTRFFVSYDGGTSWSHMFDFMPYGSLGTIRSDVYGNVYVLFQTLDAQFKADALRFNVSHDSGATWFPDSFIVTSLNIDFTFPHLECDPKGHVYAAWRDTFPDDTLHIFAASSVNFGESFSPVTQIDADPQGGNRDPVLTADCLGDVYVAWPHAPTLINVSNDFGSTWLSEPLPLEPSDYGTNYVGIAANDSGQVFVAYSTPRPYDQVWMNYSLDGGRSFLQQDIQVSALNSVGPRVACDGRGQVAVVHENFARPIGTFMRIGHADLAIGLDSGSPRETFVTVPPEGGPIFISGLLRNQSSSPLIGVLAAIEVLSPKGRLLGTTASKHFSLRPGAMRTASIQRSIPGSLKSGLYRWRLNVGTPVDDQASFCMLKE